MSRRSPADAATTGKRQGLHGDQVRPFGKTTSVFVLPPAQLRSSLNRIWVPSFSM